MVEVYWNGLEGEELRYREQTWKLTGDVDVLENGSLLAVEARETGDVRGRSARLYFSVPDGSDSLNPGNLGENFERLERTDDAQVLVVRTDRKSYRYQLRRLEYE